MSLVQTVSDIEHQLQYLRQDAKSQQTIYFTLIQGMVELQQKYRVAKQYEHSDKIRALLNSIGIVIVQGTDGMSWDEIERKFKGKPQPPVGDTWNFKGNIKL